MTEGLFGEGRRGRTAILAIALSVAAVLAYDHYRAVDRPYVAERFELHRAILAGEAPAPYRYRLLAPCLAEAARRLFDPLLGEENGFLAAYAAFDTAALLFSLWMLFVYLRSWFTAERSLIGVLFAAATMPVALRDHFFQPWSLPEPGFLAAGLLLVYRRRYGLLALVVALASLNRETALIIPVAFFLSFAGAAPARRGAPGRQWAIGMALVAIWAFVFFGLRRFLGPAPPVEKIAGLMARNTSEASLLRAALRGALLFGAFWVFAVLGIRRSPRFVRRTALLVPIYLVPVALWGVWHEARLLLPLTAVVVPLGCSFLFGESSTGIEPSAPTSGGSAI